MNIKVVAACVVAALVVSVGVYIHTLHGRIDTLKERNATLTTTVELQNSAVKQFKEESERRKRAGEEVVKAGKAVAEPLKQKAQVIYKTVPASGDDCKDALALLNGGRS